MKNKPFEFLTMKRIKNFSKQKEFRIRCSYRAELTVVPHFGHRSDVPIPEI